MGSVNTDALAQCLCIQVPLPWGQPLQSWVCRRFSDVNTHNRAQFQHTANVPLQLSMASTHRNWVSWHPPPSHHVLSVSATVGYTAWMCHPVTLEQPGDISQRPLGTFRLAVVHAPQIIPSHATLAQSAMPPPILVQS